MELCRVALAASVVSITACQLDLAGTGPVARPESPDPSGATDPDGGSPDPMGFAPTAAPSSAAAMGMPGHGGGHGPTDASTAGTRGNAIDDASVIDAGGLDSSTAADDADAGPCARLLRCCPALVIPPLAAACFAESIQDGGDSACDTALSSLADAGLCQ